jgi:hypothetical protein
VPGAQSVWLVPKVHPAECPAHPDINGLASANITVNLTSRIYSSPVTDLPIALNCPPLACPASRPLRVGVFRYDRPNAFHNEVVDFTIKPDRDFPVSLMDRLGQIDAGRGR